MAESADQDDDAGTQAAGERPAPATDGEPADGADTDSTATDDLDPAERRCGISLGGDE